MENPELKKLESFWPEAGIRNRSEWLSNNLEEMNRSVEQMLKAIKQNSDNFPISSDMESQVEEFSRLYQSLVENVLSPELQVQVPVYSDCGSPQGTPELASDKKQGFDLSSNRGLDISFDSGGGSSSLSLKDGTDSSSSSSSSDSESESFNSSVDNNYAVSAQRAGRVPKKTLLELETELPRDIKGEFWVDEDDKVNYDELHDRIARIEEELKVSNTKLQSSENEVARLKSKLEKNEIEILLSEGLQSQLESAEKDKQEMEIHLQLEKVRVVELEQQIEQLGTRVSESDSKVERLLEDIETSKENLQSSDNQITRLTHELEITKSDHHLHIKELETAFQVSQQRFHAEKEQIQTDILRQVEAEKAEMRALHNAHQTGLQGEISQLKDELFVRSESLEALNRNRDELELKYDKVLAEKDEISAMVQRLVADKESIESRVQNLQVEKERLNKQIDELKLRNSEMEEEVKMKKLMIEDGAEGKKEAIRQLCFCLEYYRSGYQELRGAFVRLKPRSVLSV